MISGLFDVLDSAAEVQRAVSSSSAERVMTKEQVDVILAILTRLNRINCLWSYQLRNLPLILHCLLSSPSSLSLPGAAACCEGSTVMVLPKPNNVLAIWLTAARKNMKRRCCAKHARALVKGVHDIKPSEEDRRLFETYAAKLDALT